MSIDDPQLHSNGLFSAECGAWIAAPSLRMPPDTSIRNGLFKAGKIIFPPEESSAFRRRHLPSPQLFEPHTKNVCADTFNTSTATVPRKLEEFEMGKKSRAKKERANLRERRGVRILDKDDVRQLVNEVVSFFNEVPNTMVNEKLLKAFVSDDAAAMDEIAALARTFGVPLAEFHVGVTDYTTNTTKLYELPLAAFLLDNLRIFSWFMSQPEWTKSKAMAGLTNEIVCSLEGLSAAPIKQEMATIFVRHQLRFLHEFDQLEAHLANPEAEWHQGSFGAGILATFKAEVESEREKAALTALVVDQASPSHIAPSVEAPRQALRI